LTASLSLLSLWTSRRIQIFLSSLQRNLHKVADTATLRDVLDSTLFFSTSMGRIGADFQSLLPPIFESRLVSIISGVWTSAVAELEKTLKICRETGVAGPLYTDAIPAMENSVDTDENIRTPLPPRQLLSLPPMARFLNSYLEGLNEIRRCLLVGTFTPLRLEVDNIVDKVKTVLLANERAVLTPGLKGESGKLREVAKEMKDLFEMCVEPYCRMSLEVALGLFESKPVEEDVEEPTEEELPQTQPDTDTKEENEQDQLQDLPKTEETTNEQTEIEQPMEKEDSVVSQEQKQTETLE